MNLKALSQNQLFANTKLAVHEERLSTIKVLHHFREIERRRAFLGYSSLFDLAVKHFGYSPAGAQRRISAMRLLKDVPEFESKIGSGALSLTAASMAQSYFKRSHAKTSEKVDLLNSCLNKSSREVEKEIKKLEPEADKRQDIRYSNGERLRMSLNISEELYEKLEKLKYEFKAQNIEQVIERLIGERKAASPSNSKTQTQSKDHASKVMTEEEVSLKAEKQNSLPAPEVRARHIPSVTKKIVIKRNPNQCSYKYPNGKACEQRENLEFDHIHPFSKGGAHTTDNLRLVCSHHNKLLWHKTQKKL